MNPKVDLGQVATLREQILFGLVLVALIVVYANMVYSPLSLSNAVKRGRMDGLVLERDALIRFTESTPVIPAFRLSGRQDVSLRILAGDVHPVAEEIAGFLKEVTHPQFLGDVRVRDLDYSPPLTADGLERTEFSLTVVGGFSQVRGLIERLDQFPALVQIEHLAIQVPEEGSAEVEAEIRGRFFRVPTVFQPPTAAVAEERKP